MKLIRNIQEIAEEGLVATIGFFDGVHAGHRFLIRELKEEAAKRRLPSAVITFAKHPRAVLQADYQPRLLNTFEEKVRRLATTGVDYCIVLDFTIELSRLSAQDFISRILFHQLYVRALLIGYDHRFGHNRSDGFPQYVDYGAACGMDVIRASRFDAASATVSSSVIRRLLSEGNVGEAARLLTYPYALEGRVVAGYKVGRTLGFPTANIQPEDPAKLLPSVGVYAVWVGLKEMRYKGMLYIGNRPTLNNGEQVSIEVNILHFSGDIYQDEIEVSFVSRIRGDQRFDSLDALREQLQRDYEQVDRLLR